MTTPSRPTAATTTVTVLGSGERAAAAERWLALEAKLDERLGVACCWAWTSAWLDAFGDAVPHRFLVAERDGAPFGAVLVTESATRRPRQLRARTIHLGTAGEPDGSSVFVERNRLLVAEGELDAFAAAVVATLEDDRRWDRLALDGFVHDHADALIAAAPGLTARPRVEECPVTELDRARDGDLLTLWPSSRRSRIRRSLRAFGDVELQWAATAAEAHAILDELVVLHEERWRAAGEPGAFADARVRTFHRHAIDRLVPEGRAALVRVRRRTGETVGCLYGFVEDGRLLFYQAGLQRFDDNRLRAGMVTHVLAMTACLERGLRTYDFLAPPSRYKLELATGSEPLTWAQLDRPRMRLRAERRLRALRRRLRHPPFGG